MNFRWNDWNIEHVSKHGVDPEEVEHVIRTAAPPYPRVIADDKRLVRGRGPGGRFLQVIFVFDPDGTAYVIHARPLDEDEKRNFRRSTRR